MKKVILTLCIVLFAAASVFADGGKGKTDQPIRYLYSKGSQNWFLDLAVSGSFFQSSDFSFKKFGPIHGPFIGGSARVGKMLTPSVGFRLAYDYHPSKNHHAAEIGYFSYKNLRFDMMFSVLDILGKNDVNRFYRMYLVGGMGLLGYDVNGGTLFFTRHSAFELGITGGLMNCFRISRSFDFHIDLQATVMRWSFDEFVVPDPHRIHTDIEVLAGINWYIGGRVFEAAKECEECDYTEKDNQIKNLQDEVNRLQAAVEAAANTPGESKPCDTIVKFVNVDGQMISYPFSIFFNKGSYELRDGRDRVNLEEIANVAKKNGYKINLRGSCDSATGSSNFNKTLAENRCRKIKDELVKMGVAEKDIVINEVGGVKELTPAEYDRRVLVSLIKE